jgi:hypothetical protein
MALRMALLGAFREVYLFGVDLGTRDPSAHHSKEAIYNRNADWQPAEDNPVIAMTIELPGNFGGKSYTNQILHWARMMMGQTIATFSTAKIFNCSDGASIPGTFPKLAQTIRVPDKPARKVIACGRLRAELDSKRPGDMASIARVKKLRDAFREYYKALRSETARAINERVDFVTFYERLYGHLVKKNENPFQTVLRSVNIGTLMMCCQSGYYYYRRVPADKQLDVMRVFLNALDERLQAMAATVDALLAKLSSTQAR